MRPSVLVPAIAYLTLLLAGCSEFPGQARIKIYHEDMSQFEVVSPGEVPVYIDVFDPARLSHRPNPRAIMFESYFISLQGTHMDYLIFKDKPQCPGLLRRSGQITLDDMQLSTMGALENDFPPDSHPVPTTWIGKMNSGGLSIVYLGNLGQSALTRDQAEFIGHPDIVLANLSTRQQSMTNDRRLEIIEALNPRIVVIGLTNVKTLQHLLTRHPVFYAPGHLEVSKDTLPSTITFVLAGKEEKIYAELANARPWPDAGR